MCDTTKVLRLKDGTVVTVNDYKNYRNFSNLIKYYLGDDCQRYFDEEIINHYLDNEEYMDEQIDSLYELIEDLNELIYDLNEQMADLDEE